MIYTRYSHSDKKQAYPRETTSEVEITIYRSSEQEYHAATLSSHQDFFLLHTEHIHTALAHEQRERSLQNQENKDTSHSCRKKTA